MFYEDDESTSDYSYFYRKYFRCFSAGWEMGWLMARGGELFSWYVHVHWYYYINIEIQIFSNTVY